MIRREEYLKKIERLIDKEEIKIITGIRRSGKTCLLKQIIAELKNKGIKEENIIYLPLESSKYDNIESHKDLNELIFKKTENITGKIYLLFDEIQLVENWEKSINSYRIDLDCDIYITGSNSRLLSGELATLIAGRYIKIEIYPFSFKECLSFYKNEKEKKSYHNPEISLQEEKEIFQEYLKYGGMPRVLKYEEEEKLNYLYDVYNSIVLKDIISRNNIRNISLLERLIKYLISNSGQTHSSESIRKYLKHEKVKVSTNTIANYIRYAMDSYILLKAQKEDMKTKKTLTINEKYYCIDPGFYQLQTGTEKSRCQILENIVYLELKRRGYDVTFGNVNGLEIDFIIRKYNETAYIQVTESLLDEKTRQREFEPFKYIRDNYPKYVISLDDWDYSYNGIRHMNMIDFLKTDRI